MKTRPRTPKRMSAEVEQMRVSDRLFFERFPWRQHRMRRLSRGEITQLEEAAGARLVVTDPDDVLFVIVKSIAPGVRLRMHLPGPGTETGDDATEAQIAALWERRASRNPAIIQQEMQIRDAMCRPGGPLYHKGGA